MKKFLPTNQSDLQRMVWEMMNEQTKVEYRFGNFDRAIFNMADSNSVISDSNDGSMEN